MLKTLNEWLKSYGYQWVEGREQLFKAQISPNEAVDLMGQLAQEGAITRVDRRNATNT